MTTRQIWEIDDYNRIIDGTTKVLLFTVDTSSDDDPLPIMRKIAAAPAMYEALQQAQELLRSLVAEEMIHTTELQRVGNCQATMWQALAQAEGR